MELAVSAVPREKVGKGTAHKLRQTGFIPAVLYGEGKETEHISVSTHDFEAAILKGGTGRLFVLKLKKGSKEATNTVLIKDFQRHPLKGTIVHVDFLRVAMDHFVTVKVPIHLENEEKRLRDGSIVEVKLHELEISCLPGNIPERLSLDVSHLTNGTSVLVKDVPLPIGIKVLNAPEEMVIAVTTPKAVEDITAQGEPTES